MLVKLSAGWSVYCVLVHAVVFWIVTQRDDVIRYKRFEGRCCLYLQDVTTEKITT